MPTVRFAVPFAVVAMLGLTACGPDDRRGSAGKPDESTGVASKVESRHALGAPEFWEPVPDDGVELGLGWDSQQGRVIPNRCVRLAPVRSTGQTTEMSLSEVSDRSDVMKSLKVSAAGSVKTMFASASGSASFASSTKVSSQSTTLLMNASVTNGVLFAGPAEAPAMTRTAFPDTDDARGAVPEDKDSGRLTFEPWALELLKQPQEFRKYCGDGYVSAITSGARLLATITISSKSSSARKSVASSFKASYGPANVSGGASGSSAVDTSGTSIQMRYMQVGGAKGPIATSKEKLDEKLAVLAWEAYKSPRFQDMRVTPYSQMAEWSGSDAWRDTDDEYEIIAETYWQLTTLEDDVTEILANYKEYDERTGLPESELKTFRDDILTLRRAIYRALSADTEVEAAVEGEADSVLTLIDMPVQSKLEIPRGINLKVLSDNPTLGELADELRKAMPPGIDSAALLRINLPIRKPGDNDKAVANDKASLQQAVLDQYVVPGARRACQQNPTDNACLSNAELDRVKALVPARPKA